MSSCFCDRSLIRGMPLSSCMSLGRALQAKVASIIVDGGWIWPRGRSSVSGELLAHNPNTFLFQVDAADSVNWTLGKSGMHSVKTAWKAVRQHGPVVPCNQVLWFKHHVPRFSNRVWWHFLEQNGICRLLLPLAHQVEWFINHKTGGSLHHLVPKLAFAAVLYNLLERKEWRNFGAIHSDEEGVNARITTDIRSYLSSWRNA
ncbi:hypothetical protein Vadar_003989 [Vaccinium darrowii]|uniref:Uncharacterized protein n=1 Tax=Vaccinium darrowii TaxID=229202 RepID=A0ACB7XNF8_9ERIC|nr:hypothetical protein Vadar_003989 [Vaccinium darrowii]